MEYALNHVGVSQKLKGQRSAIRHLFKIYLSMENPEQLNWYLSLEFIWRIFI